MIRITIREAQKRFSEDKPIILCPCKLRPGLPFASDVTIHPDAIAEWKEKAKFYAPVGEKPAGALWEGSIDKTAWSLMYNNWSNYNTSWEAGYYAAYYVDSNWPN